MYGGENQRLPVAGRQQSWVLTSPLDMPCRRGEGPLERPGVQAREGRLVYGVQQLRAWTQLP